MAKTASKKGARGRPPAGPDGEQVNQYRHQFATRTPGSVFHQIRAIKAITGVSYRHILTNALTLYLAHRIAREDRAAIEKLSKRTQAACTECREEAQQRQRL